jgi:K+/H+ antiporter YhaU regulatory subunit KhtT
VVALTLPGNLIDRSIGVAEIRKTTRASVVGIIREQLLIANPDVGFRFQNDRGGQGECAKNVY